MVIPAPLRHAGAAGHLLHHRRAVLVHTAELGLRRLPGVVLCGIQHRFPHILAVLQHLPAIHLRVIVPVHHQRLVGGIHRVVIEIAAQGHVAPAQLSLQLGIGRQQLLVVLQFGREEVGALLDVGDAGGPEQVQQIHPLHADVAQAVQLAAVPEYTVHGAAGFQLVPPGGGIGALELVLLQDHRQDAAQPLGLQPVVRLAGQHGGGGVAVHGVGVLGQDTVHQPSAGGLGVSAVAALPLLLHLFPVAQLPELLVVDDALLQMQLSMLVHFQDRVGSAQLVPADLRLYQNVGGVGGCHGRCRVPLDGGLRRIVLCHKYLLHVRMGAERRPAPIGKYRAFVAHLRATRRKIFMKNPKTPENGHTPHPSRP